MCARFVRGGGEICARLVPRRRREGGRFVKPIAPRCRATRRAPPPRPERAAPPARRRAAPQAQRRARGASPPRRTTWETRGGRQRLGPYGAGERSASGLYWRGWEGERSASDLYLRGWEGTAKTALRAGRTPSALPAGAGQAGDGAAQSPRRGIQRGWRGVSCVPRPRHPPPPPCCCPYPCPYCTLPLLTTATATTLSEQQRGLMSRSKTHRARAPPSCAPCSSCRTLEGLQTAPRAGAARRTRPARASPPPVHPRGSS